MAHAGGGAIQIAHTSRRCDPAECRRRRDRVGALKPKQEQKVGQAGICTMYPPHSGRPEAVANMASPSPLVPTRTEQASGTDAVASKPLTSTSTSTLFYAPSPYSGSGPDLRLASGVQAASASYVAQGLVRWNA
ncbi:hypothetical protein VDGL01_02863 [Verticillium dahliae]